MMYLVRVTFRRDGQHIDHVHPVIWKLTQRDDGGGAATHALE